MTGRPGWNEAAFGAAFALSTALAWVPAPGSAAHATLATTATPGSLPWQRSRGAGPARSASGAPGAPLRDHTGVLFPPKDYRRIVSGSALADELLLELCEPDRVVAFTAYGATEGPGAYRYRGKPTIERLEDLEAVVALRPDLVLVNESDARIVARLREAGFAVYDLGERRGLATLLPNVREVAALVGHPERGERLARSIVEQLNAVAADVPPSRRRSAMYLSVYGGRPFGGAAGTSYHDVLLAAGLDDAAAGYRDWPEYSTEQIALLDPELIVTNAGMRARICGHAGFAKLRACAQPGGVIEIGEGMLGDPGPAMVDAARAVRDLAYGAPAPRALDPAASER